MAGLRGEGVSYIFAGKSQLDLALTLDILNRDLGVKRLLVEGGGRINGAFLRGGLVDELSLIPSVATKFDKNVGHALTSQSQMRARRIFAAASTQPSRTRLGGSQD